MFCIFTLALERCQSLSIVIGLMMTGKTHWQQYGDDEQTGPWLIRIHEPLRLSQLCLLAMIPSESSFSSSSF